MATGDHPTPEAIAEFEAKRAAYLARAKETYPSARARFLAGLPAGTVFMVAKFATDAAGHDTLLLAEIERIADGQVFGREYQGPAAPHGSGPSVSFPESDVVDWLIQTPGGETEGWYLGKFLYEAHTGTSSLD